MVTKYEEDTLTFLERWRDFWYEKNILMQLATKLTFAYLLLLELLAFCSLYMNLNANYWGKYLPSTIMALFIVFNYITFYLKYDECVIFWDYYHSVIWPVENEKNIYLERLKTESWQVKVCLVVGIVFCVIAGTVLLPWFGDEYEYYVQVKILTDYLWLFGTSRIAIALWYLSIYNNLFVFVGNVVGILNLALRCKFQMILLVNELDEIALELEDRDIEVAHIDKNLQESIRKKLIKCVKQHAIIVEFVRKINDFIFIPAFTYTISGVIIALCIPLMKISDDTLFFSPLLFRAGFVGPGIISCMMALIVCGQSVEDLSEEIANGISKLPWYICDRNNKYMISMITACARKPLNLSSAGVITVNNNLLITVGRNIYTFTMFVLNFKKL